LAIFSGLHNDTAQNLRHGLVTSVWAAAIFILLSGKTLPADEPDSNSALYPSLQPLQYSQPCEDYSGAAQQGCFLPIMHKAFEDWHFDYRVRSLSSSYTSYQFGTPDPPPIGWTPLSKLDFSLNSMWHGIGVGLEKPNWAAHFEWLTPIEQGVHGNLEDYDWMNSNATFTDLGIARQRWTDGQMLDFRLEIRLCDNLFGLPIEFWPTGGFRWQKFDIMCYDAVQVKENNVWPPNPHSYPGDGLTFNQQYYVCYFGAQFRTRIGYPEILPIDLIFQGDLGNANAYNIDHHLLREGDRYTMESTHGDSWHISLTAEVPIRKSLSLGFEGDYLQIRTCGTHRLLNEPLDIDATWDNGVRNQSNQTWLTFYVRYRI
jgi:hypothetical protein